MRRPDEARVDPHPQRGSFLFYAGWTEHGMPIGSAGHGRDFVPLQLVKAFSQMSDAHSFVRGGSRRIATRH